MAEGGWRLMRGVRLGGHLVLHSLAFLFLRPIASVVTLTVPQALGHIPYFENESLLPRKIVGNTEPLVLWKEFHVSALSPLPPEGAKVCKAREQLISCAEGAILACKSSVDSVMSVDCGAGEKPI